MDQQKEAPVAAVYKAFGILEALSEGTASLAEISRKGGLPKSSASRFLATLMDLGFVRKTGQGEFTLTAKMFNLGARALSAMELVPAAAPFMQALGEQTRETVHLAVRSETAVIYLYKVDSSHTLCMQSRAGFQNPLYCTSLGKSLLAWLDEAKIDAAIRDITFEKKMPNTITDPAVFRAHLDEVKRQGYSCDNEEIEENVICFGMPVFDWALQPIAAISVSMPLFRFSEEQKGSLLARIRRAAYGISAMFGYAGEEDRYPEAQKAALRE
jgi:IclR family KDG regulon transcriptional repressor